MPINITNNSFGFVIGYYSKNNCWIYEYIKINKILFILIIIVIFYLLIKFIFNYINNNYLKLHL